jgi:hypothetical protein
MMDLIRERRVMRFRRRWVAALELPPELRPSSKMNPGISPRSAPRAREGDSTPIRDGLKTVRLRRNRFKSADLRRSRRRLMV